MIDKVFVVLVDRGDIPWAVVSSIIVRTCFWCKCCESLANHLSVDSLLSIRLFVIYGYRKIVLESDGH